MRPDGHELRISRWIGHNSFASVRIEHPHRSFEVVDIPMVSHEQLHSLPQILSLAVCCPDNAGSRDLCELLAKGLTGCVCGCAARHQPDRANVMGFEESERCEIIHICGFLCQTSDLQPPGKAMRVYDYIQ